MQSVGPETRRTPPALLFWVGATGKQSQKGRVNGVIPVFVLRGGRGSHVAFTVERLRSSEVIHRGFLKGDLGSGVRDRSGSEELELVLELELGLKQLEHFAWGCRLG